MSKGLHISQIDQDWRQLLSPLCLAEGMDPQWETTRHHLIIDYEFRKLWEPGNDTDILVISAPPRSGKSTYLSHWAPAHWICRNPYKTVMLCSYGARLASWLSRRVRDRVHRCAPLFGLKGVNPAVSKADEWELDETGGGMLSAGVDGSITGRGAHLILIDDYMRKGKDAASATVRDNQWEWLQSTLSTRREPGGKIVILACLTGDAMVSMADGSLRPMRLVRAGDRVLSYRDGRLCSAPVSAHCRLSNDDVFQVRLRSGKTVTGNGQHPFLVEENGVLKWVQLRNLNTAMRIVTVAGSGGNGRGRPASGRTARRRQNAGAIVRRTMPKKGGRMVIGRHRSRLAPGASRSTSIATGSRSRTMRRCLNLRTGAVLPAGVRRRYSTCIKESSGLSSITTTNPERFEGCSVRTATLPQEDLRPLPGPLGSLDTSKLRLDPVAAIVSKGREVVYDLQVEGTQAFVANGMVTHNTPWHSDDIIGRIMRQRDEMGLKVRRIVLQAIYEDTSVPDPLGRSEGEALWPSRWDLETMEKQKALMGPYWWRSQYLGLPGQYGTNEWPERYFTNIWAQDDEWPTDQQSRLAAVALDPSKGRGDKSDFQALCHVIYHEGLFWLDFDVDRRPVPEMMRNMAQFCKERNPAIVGLEGNAFQELLAPDYLAACQAIGYHQTTPELITNTVQKELRIMRLGAFFDQRKFRIRRNSGGQEFMRQAREFPNGDHDDACFVKGTPISTPDGDVPIEKIRPGDIVSTRFGPRRVLVSGPTGVQPVCKVTSQGRSLTGTPDHPVLSGDGTWRPMLESCSMVTWGAESCQKSRQLCSRESSSGDIQNRINGLIETISSLGASTLKRASSRSIRRSGCSSTVSSLLGTLSTMSTEIRRITLWRIWNASRQQNMPIDTSHLQSVFSNLGNTWTPSEAGLQNGTGQTKVASGIGSTVVDAWRIAPQSLMSARSAIRNSSLRARQRSSADPSVASDSTRLSVAPVERGRILGSQEVFNLTVEGVHEYIAGGFVVHNCDACEMAVRLLNYLVTGNWADETSAGEILVA